MAEAATRQRGSDNHIGLIFAGAGENIDVLSGFEAERRDILAGNVDEFHVTSAGSEGTPKDSRRV